MTFPPNLKRWSYDQLHRLARTGDVSCYAPDAQWFGCHPFNEIRGRDAIGDVWRALRVALPDMERRDQIFIAGASKPDARSDPALEGRHLVAAMGVYQGSFMRDLCGIPATHGVVNLRFCEVHHVDGTHIRHSYVLLDLLDLMRQAGIWPLAPSLGAEAAWQGPAGGDGVRPDEIDGAGGDAGFATVMAMHAALLSFDGVSLQSMDHDAFWDENFLWYGPAGIGTTRGMAGFRAHHQIPFLIGFPDREGTGHYVRIADGDFVATGGWPSVAGTHLGEWCGLPPTGRRIEMRVMDFYRLSNGRIVENWVPIDVIHMALQMGYDIFARLSHLRGDHPGDLPRRA